MLELWYGLVSGLGEVLRFFQATVEPVMGVYAWGWAIILLTFAVRLVLVPLAVKQIRSQRAMQQLQPQMKKIQAKYKTDRQMMRTNPEKFRERRTKQQEEMSKLFKENKVNPAAGCLPLIAQMPVFFALFQLLSGRFAVSVGELEGAPFYGIASLSLTPAPAGFGAWVLVVLMGLTTYWSQRQMMASNPTASQMPQQKVLLYVMPLILPLFAINLPVGVLLYWVTTNVWTMGQQYLMFRNIEPAAPAKS